jgi:hypothetical protein
VHARSSLELAVADPSFALQCACGRVEGRVASTHRAGRAICYGRDCQAFARFLGPPETTLDSLGGSDIIATAPRFVQFTAGTAQLQCMSLGPRGLLRWYAGCRRRPIGNIPRNPKLSYMGPVHNCLAGSPAAMDAAFGPARLAPDGEPRTGGRLPPGAAGCAGQGQRQARLALELSPRLRWRWSSSASTATIARRCATSHGPRRDPPPRYAAGRACRFLAG